MFPDPAYDPLAPTGAFDDQFAPPWPPPEWQTGGAPVDLGPPPPDIAPTAAPMPDLAPQQSGPPPFVPVAPTFNPFVAPPPEALPNPFAQSALPDALTGAAGQDVALPFAEQAPSTQLTPEQGYRQSAQRLVGSPFDPSTGDIRADVSDADLERYLDTLNQRDPLKAIAFNQQLNDLKVQRVLTEKARIENEAFDRLKQIDEDRRVAREAANRKAEAIDADAIRIMNEHIDPSGGVTGGRAVAGILAAFMGGLVQGKTGSPVNAGLQALNTAIDRGIDAQKADLANRRGGIDLRRNMLADEIGRHGDEFRAQEAMRVAAQTHALQMLDIEMQNYSPRGTSFAKAAAMKAGLVAQMAKSAQERNDKLVEAGLKEREQNRKEFETRQNALHQRATTALGYAQIKAQKDERDFLRDQKRQEKEQERTDKETERLRRFSMHSPRSAIALDQGGNPIIGPDGKPQTTGEQFMNVDKDGKRVPWTIEDPEQRRAMTTKIVSASELDDIINEVRDIRKNVGRGIMPWSNARTRLKVLKSTAGLGAKAATQGMSSDKDFERIEDSFSADSFNSFVDLTAGLDEVQGRLAFKLSNEMHGAGYNGPAVSFSNRWTRATNTAEDDRRQALLRNPDQSLDDAIKANLDRVTADRGYGIDINDPADQQLYQGVVQSTQRSFTPGATGDQAKQIADEGRKAAAGDAAAVDILKEIAANGQSGDLRRLAKAELEALNPKATPRGPQSGAVHVPDELRLP